MSLVVQTGAMKYRESASDSWHPLIIRADAALDTLVDQYDATETRTWAAGELCLHNGEVFRCNSGISTPKAWTASDWTQTTVSNEISRINSDIGALCIKGAQSTISANGMTSAISCPGLTANHRVMNWGMYSDANFTTPIASNAPPADIMITEGNGSYTITVANFSSTFYIQPIFILPQN